MAVAHVGGCLISQFISLQDGSQNLQMCRGRTVWVGEGPPTYASYTLWRVPCWASDSFWDLKGGLSIDGEEKRHYQAISKKGVTEP